MVALPPVGIVIPLWPWILWNLWKARNKLLFDGRSFTDQEIILKAIKDAKEWQTAQLNDQSDAVPTPATTLRTRRSPITRSFTGATCHVDAAWCATTLSCGIGGIFKATSFPIPTICLSLPSISSALMAEAIAVRSAVMTAAASNIQSLTVLSDSQILISLLKNKESRPALFGIMSDIYYFSKLFETISFVFVPRLLNLEADIVAKSALSLPVMSPFRE